MQQKDSFVIQLEYEVTRGGPRDCKEGCKCLGKDNISLRILLDRSQARFMSWIVSYKWTINQTFNMLWGTKLNIATNDGENKAYQIPSRILQDIWKEQASFGDCVAVAKKVYLSQRQLKWSVLIRFYCWVIKFIVWLSQLWRC